MAREKSDRQSVREFVQAHRDIGDPRGFAVNLTGEPRKVRARKAPAGRKAAGPVDAAPRLGGPVKRVPFAPPAVRAPKAPRRSRGLTTGQRDAVFAGQHIANRQQTESLLGGKPSVSGAAVAGGAGGAATGAALGSVVPGIGTGIGAGTGAALGTAGGALSGAKRKRAYRKAASQAPGARKALVAEFTVCMIIVALSPLTDKHQADTPNAWMKRMTALMGVFLVLALVSAFGRGGARTSAAFGGLVTVVLAVSERDLFVKVANIFGGVPVAEKPSGAGEEAALAERP